MRQILFILLLGGLLGAGIACAATPTEAPIPTKVAKSVAVASPVPGAGTPAPKSPPPTTLVPTPTINRIPATKPIKMNSPEYGAQAFLWWRPETADRDLGLMRDAGLTWVKQQFAWRDIEGAKKGAFNWENADRAVQLANSFGIDVLAH